MNDTQLTRFIKREPIADKIKLSGSIPWRSPNYKDVSFIRQYLLFLIQILKIKINATVSTHDLLTMLKVLYLKVYLHSKLCKINWKIFSLWEIYFCLFNSFSLHFNPDKYINAYKRLFIGKYILLTFSSQIGFQLYHSYLYRSSHL